MSILLTAFRIGAVFAVCGAAASAQTAKQIRGATPYVVIKDEPPPQLFVDPPLAEALQFGVLQVQYRVENLHIVPVFGEAATKVSPRVGHLHITVDGGPHWSAEASDVNTIDVGNFAPGKHKVKIELVDANHMPFPRAAKTVEFTIPPYDRFKPHGNP